MFRLRRHPKREIIEDYDDDKSPGYRRKQSRRLCYWILLILVTVISSLAWRSAQADEERAWVQGPADVQAGQLLLQRDGQSGYRASVIHSGEVHFQISGMVAHATLKQAFRNTSADWVQGVYAFPLPEKAAVNRLTMKIGDRVIEGRIKEKQQARKIYKAAVASGRKAGLVEQQRPNMFTTRIANIPPGATISVELQYLQTVSYQHGQFGLRFPMTITPRYIPGAPLLSAAHNGETNNGDTNNDESMAQERPLEQQLVFDSGMGWAFNTDQVPDAESITPLLHPRTPTGSAPINPIKITADIDMGMPLSSIDSAYHSIVLSRQDNRYSLRLSQGVVSMEQDFVLNWLPVTGTEPTAALFSETLFSKTIDNEHYALIMVLPPVREHSVQALPKEVIVIIDTSGSMDGVSIRQARQSLLMALDQLQPADRFNIIEFNSTTHALFARAVDADANNLAHARNYVQKITSGGGTEMLPALRAALKDQAPEGYVRQVIFITDGAVGNEAALFSEIHNTLGNSRLFTVGIGSAPNSWFMRKAAQFGRGTFTHIGMINEVQEKMSALFAKLNSPVMSNISLDWPAATQAEVYPQKIPDLYRGEPLLISANLKNTRGELVISGDIVGKPWKKIVQFRSGAQQRGVATLWAREKISSLLDGKVTGRSDADIRNDVLPVALTHQLISPYTSFVAVEKTASRPVDAKLTGTAIPNTRPKGQGPQFYAYPKTATRGTQSVVLGLTFGLLAWLWLARFCKEGRKEGGYEPV